VPPYRFLFDRDVEGAADALPARRVLTLAKVELPETASDDAIIDAACANRSIIVTANGKDFRPAALKYIAQSSRRSQGRCHDLSGLVVLPTGLEIQRRLLREAPQRMRYAGRPVTWADVWGRSYYVRLKKSGPAEVNPLPGCGVCKKREIGREKRKKRSV
jgi:hypothetical protein